MPYTPQATATPPADYLAVKDYLYALKAGGVKFGIDRMRRLVAELGHPERSYPVIHVAGTNGKGSVAAMLESILRAGGRRTGLYTSPHLVKLGERVQVDRRLLTEDEIVAYVRELQPVAARAAAFAPDEHATFFEFMTAMAFLQFQRRQVDVAVVEVGMGGRLDATNVVQPAVTVITSIGLDHCAELGDTVERIAAEKAGIIKPGIPVVIGRLPAGAERVIREVAAAQGAPVHAVREIFGEDLAGYPVTNLEGDYQRWNAATAVTAARLLPPALQPEVAAIERGLGQVAWPGRKPIIVAGVLGEFRARALLEVVARHAREIHLVTPQQARATPYADMVKLAPPEARPLLRENSVAGIFPAAGTCALGAPGDTVVITGSIYLLGEILERLEPDRGAGEGKLQDF